MRSRPGVPAASGAHDLGAARSNTLVPVALISYSRRLTSLAEQDPDRRAITCGDRSITRSELEAAANRLARDLLEGGAAAGDMGT
jgi:non-ribosomal peptide synthetase component F